MASNCACASPAWTSAGRVLSWRNRSQSFRQSANASAGGGTYVAVDGVDPGAPIQFCVRRNSPGAAALPRTSVMSSSCASRTRRSDSGSVPSRSTAYSSALT